MGLSTTKSIVVTDGRISVRLRKTKHHSERIVQSCAPAFILDCYLLACPGIVNCWHGLALSWVTDSFVSPVECRIFVASHLFRVAERILRALHRARPEMASNCGRFLCAKPSSHLFLARLVFAILHGGIHTHARMLSRNHHGTHFEVSKPWSLEG